MKVKWGKIGKKMSKGVGKMGKDFKASPMAKASRTPAHLTPPKKSKGGLW